MRQEWTEIVIASFRDVLQRLILVTPQILAAVTLVVLGWLVAAAAGRLTTRLLRTVDLDGRCGRWGLTPLLGRRGVRQAPSDLAGRLVFWVLLLVGLLMGIEALGMSPTAGLVAGAVRFLPNLLVAAFVMVAGWILANFLAQSVLIAAVNAQVAGAPLLAECARWLVLLFAGASVLTQLGIAREMVLLAFGIAFGGAVLALALAFGFGARDMARQALEGWLRRREQEETDQISHV